MLSHLLTAFAAVFAATTDARHVITSEPNNCISFQVSAGTGCAWMCNYCANTLGTSNYYFTDGVCTYQAGGCVGSPQVGVLYTCCAN